MIRIAFLELLLFATPFILFAFWRLAMQATRDVAHNKAAPVGLLSIAGGALAAFGLIVLAMWSDTGTSENQRYVPPRLEDGRIAGAEFTDEAGERAPTEDRPFANPSETVEGEDDDGSPQPR